METNGLQPHSGKQEAFLWIFLDDDEGNAEAIQYTPLSGGNPENRERIQAWFDRAKKEGIRAWNAKFDRAFAEQAGFDIPGDGMWYDGMIYAHAINERRSVALKAVAKELFGDEAADDQMKVKTWLKEERARRKKQATEAGTELIEPNYSDVPMEIMEPYGLEDVILTRKISDQYLPIINQTPDLKRVVDFEHGVLDALYAVEKRGIPASATDYRHLEQECISNLDALEEKIDELAAEGGVEDFNPKSSPQIIAALKGREADLTYATVKDGDFEGPWIDLAKKDPHRAKEIRETGKGFSADAESLRNIDDELAATILEFRAEFKVLSTYVRPMIGRHYDKGMRMWKEPFLSEDGRIHANYRQLGARTGRMSCSDPNIQNQPRDDLRLRYCIRAEPGYKLVTCDLSNIEMVLFAAYCGNGKLLEAVQAGEDLHELTAKMLGFRDRERSGGNFESARQQGKTYNFSRIYGGGLRTIQKSFRCDRDHARLLKKRFDEAYPEVKRLTDRIQYRLYDQGYISDKLISGRRFRVEPSEAYKGTNYLVQGTAASLLKEAVVKLHQDGVPIVALVHDEIIAHVPEAEAESARDLIIQRMTENEDVRNIVPLSADGVICDHWSDAKPLKDGSLFVPNWVSQ